jgi:hypothetical protein
VRTLGINRAGSVWITPEDAALLGRAGLWYRVDFRAEFPDELKDTAFRLLRRNGVRFLPILLWEQGRPRTGAAWSAWLAYVDRTVRRYPSQRYWQVWNEPNYARVKTTYFGEDPVGWRDFMRRTAGHIKRANELAVVVAGGISVGSHGSRQITNYRWHWFEQKPVVDRVAIHTYCADPGYACKAIARAQAAATQRVWCTELGRKSTVDGETGQAAWLRRMLAGTGNVPLFWYDLQDVEGAFDGFGALRRDRTRKPVWHTLMR